MKAADHLPPKLQSGLEDYKAGRVDRRAFLNRALMYGLSAPLVSGLLGEIAGVGVARAMGIHPLTGRLVADMDNGGPGDHNIWSFNAESIATFDGSWIWSGQGFYPSWVELDPTVGPPQILYSRPSSVTSTTTMQIWRCIEGNVNQQQLTSLTFPGLEYTTQALQYPTQARNGLIAFRVDYGGNGSTAVYVMGPNGESPHAILGVSWPNVIGPVCIDIQGDWIYFMGNLEGGVFTGARNRIWRIHPDGSGWGAVTSSQGSASLAPYQPDANVPTVSPDGLNIACFVGVEGNEIPGPGQNVAILNADGSGRRDIGPLGSCRSVSGEVITLKDRDNPLWAPDKTLIIHSSMCSDTKIHTIVSTVDGLEIRDLGYGSYWKDGGGRRAWRGN